MKVLYIAHSRENSGWGRASRDIIKAISRQVDTVVRPVILGSNYNDPEITELEKKDLTNVTHCIQHLLPHFMSYRSGFEKNVGISFLETKNLKYTNIPTFLGLLDEIWDIGNYCSDDFITNKIVKTKQAFEFSNTNKNIIIPQINGKYKFYCIAEGVKRKNLQNIIRAFFSEFTYEPVSLVIKTSTPGKTPEESFEYFSSLINEIKNGCRMYGVDAYPSVHLITNHLEEEDLKALHKYCNCYIDFSYGESINYGMLEAAYFENDIISTENNEYARHLNLTKVCRVVEEPCYGQIYTFPNYNTSREKWGAPLIKDLMIHMRESYTNRNKYKYNMEQFSYDKMGQEYVELLIS